MQDLRAFRNLLDLDTRFLWKMTFLIHLYFIGLQVLIWNTTGWVYLYLLLVNLHQPINSELLLNPDIKHILCSFSNQYCFEE